MDNFASKTSMATLRPALMALVAASTLSGATARAETITVNNPSFEILPSGLALTPTSGGPDHRYDGDYVIGPIPGWTNSGSSGQLVLAPGNDLFYSPDPDGPTVAFSQDTLITQVLGVTARAGITYTFTYDMGFRSDFANLGAVGLMVNGIVRSGPTSLNKRSGSWETFSATYTASAADDGRAITIVLDPQHSPAMFDNIRVTNNYTPPPPPVVHTPAAVPEPTTWTLLLVGFGAAGLGLRRRTRAAA